MLNLVDFVKLMNLADFANFKKIGKCLNLHTIRKVKFLSKNSILTNPNILTSFSPNIFDNFSREIKVVNSKSKTTTFSRVFHPQKIDNFLGKLKLNFWTKNEDFEQCASLSTRAIKSRSPISHWGGIFLQFSWNLNLRQNS